MIAEQPPIEPDTKDWTWTLERPCPDCGFAAGSVASEDVIRLIDDATAPWSEVLARPDARTRQHPDKWSDLEYGCHVRDVHRIFDGRLAQMLAEDEPDFANWDQDVTALEGAYGEQDPAQVSRELTDAAHAIRHRYATVTGDQWHRRGFRSNGSEFTVLTLSQYLLHDLIHHLYDVGAPPPTQ